MRRLAAVFLLLPTAALAQADEAAALQRALDDLEVVQALLQGKVTPATREQALQQLGDARTRIVAAQQLLLRLSGQPGLAVAAGDAGAQVQVGATGAGLSLSVTIGDPAPPMMVPPPLPPPPPSAPAAMPAGAYASLLAAIQAESFGDGKLRVLRDAVRGHPLTVEQASGILPLFDFSSDRVEAAVALHPALVDPENFYRLYASFDFDADKDEVRKRLGL